MSLITGWVSATNFANLFSGDFFSVASSHDHDESPLPEPARRKVLPMPRFVYAAPRPAAPSDFETVKPAHIQPSDTATNAEAPATETLACHLAVAQESPISETVPAVEQTTATIEQTPQISPVADSSSVPANQSSGVAADAAVTAPSSQTAATAPVAMPEDPANVAKVSSTEMATGLSPAAYALPDTNPIRGKSVWPAALPEETGKADFVIATSDIGRVVWHYETNAPTTALLLQPAPAPLSVVATGSLPEPKATQGLIPAVFSSESPVPNQIRHAVEARPAQTEHTVHPVSHMLRHKHKRQAKKAAPKVVARQYVVTSRLPVSQPVAMMAVPTPQNVSWGTDNERLAEIRRTLERQQLRITQLEAEKDAASAVGVPAPVPAVIQVAAVQPAAPVAPMEQKSPTRLSDQNQPIRLLPEPAAPAPAIPTAPAPVVIPQRDRVLGGWVLRGAAAGRAWVMSTAGQGASPIEILVGSEYPEFGHIIAIYRVRAGGWSVRTDNGWFGAKPDEITEEASAR